MARVLSSPNGVNIPLRSIDLPSRSACAARELLVPRRSAPRESNARQPHCTPREASDPFVAARSKLDPHSADCRDESQVWALRARWSRGADDAQLNSSVVSGSRTIRWPDSKSRLLWFESNSISRAFPCKPRCSRSNSGSLTADEPSRVRPGPPPQPGIVEGRPTDRVTLRQAAAVKRALRCFGTSSSSRTATARSSTEILETPSVSTRTSSVPERYSPVRTPGTSIAGGLR